MKNRWRGVAAGVAMLHDQKYHSLRRYKFTFFSLNYKKKKKQIYVHFYGVYLFRQRATTNLNPSLTANIYVTSVNITSVAISVFNRKGQMF